MKIIILGAGQVGSNLAEHLVREGNDLTVVDLDAEKLAALQDRFDLRTICGQVDLSSAALIRDLKQRGMLEDTLVAAVNEAIVASQAHSAAAFQALSLAARTLR